MSEMPKPDAGRARKGMRDLLLVSLGRSAGAAELRCFFVITHGRILRILRDLAESKSRRAQDGPIRNYLAFFLEIERQWRDIPDYQSLLGHFSARRLRRCLLPMRWMEYRGLVTPDAVLREADSEWRRIQANLDRLSQGSPERMILNGYHRQLTQRTRSGAASLRSARPAIAPAASLLTFARAKGRMPPDQKVLDGYLRQTPGQRAALSGFVRYLRHEHGAKLTLPRSDPERTYRKRRKGLEAEMLTLMGKGGADPESRRRWLCAALAYFHNVPLKTGRRVREEHVTPEENGMTIRIGTDSYWIPHAASRGEPRQQFPSSFAVL